jgi:amino acid adenylation domain-containing protein
MAERHSVLNDPPKVLDGPQLLHKLIDFDRNREACAIDFSSVDHRKTYSYGQVISCVEALVSRIHKVLESRGEHSSSSHQHIIPILLPQSPGLYISQLAILESGGAFCPINLDAPPERIKFVARDVSANLIITTAEFRDSVSWERGPDVIIAEEFPETPHGDNTNRRGRSREALPDELAYVMYTSGSSGTPKGVAVSHLAASQSLLAHEKHIPRFQRFLQFAAPSFDVSVFEIFFPLKRGTTLVGCNRTQLLNDLPGMINDLEVDAAELTPTVVGSLLPKRSRVPGLRLLLTIGEMLTRPIVEEFGGSSAKESILYGMYGPTEAAIHCTIHPKMEASAKPGNIGFPFQTVSTFVAAAASSTDVDENFTCLPVGELGELVLGGPQLAQGYLNRPEQNKAAFLHTGDKSYYRTGDKARLLDDGTIEILGRMSAGQVKLRGQRVELGEIEEAVYKHESIRTVTAVVLNGALIVFALVGNHELNPEDVLKTCAKWLPKFMVPSEIILLLEFPYLPSGKVDKRTLESNYQRRREDSQNEDVESRTPAERVVKEILQSVLGSFPSTMRLAAAGLDSLVSIRVSSKLRSSGYKISTLDVLQADTVKALANICEALQTVQGVTPGIAAEPKHENTMAILNGSAKDAGRNLSCTPLQSAMLSETLVERNAYRNWIEVEIFKITDTNHIISSIHKLAAHNPILRSGFSESIDSSYVQVVWKTLDDSQFEEVQDLDYGSGRFEHPSLTHPIRFQIQILGSSARVLIHLHHALYDAWSLELLLDDLNDLLAGNVPVSRPSFTNVIDGYLRGILVPDTWTAKDYWKDHLAGLDLRQLPSFHSVKVPSKSLAVTCLKTSISTSKLEMAARNLSSSPQSIFQAAYALILSSYLGTPDICFGTVFSGRTLPIAGVEDIVGPCLSTLPIRVDISTLDSLQSLVEELNSTNRKHLQYSAVPLRDIKSVAAPNSHQSLFDTLLIWQQTLHSYDHKREHVSLIGSTDNLEFNLTLEIIPGIGNISLKANYQESIFPQVQVELLLQQVEQIAQLIISSPKTSLKDVFNQLEESILSIENKSPETIIGSVTHSSPVERIAAEDPNRPAIEFAHSIDGSSITCQRMSYSELNSHANNIGQHLLAYSVVPDELVCICLEKSTDLYAAILATAKVGAGYLPVTPDTPQDRLQHILDEAEVKVVLACSESRPLLKQFTRLKIVYVDEFDFSILSSKNIVPRSSHDNLSYCVFTSGSTGTPKGVLVTQGNLLSNLDVLEDIYPRIENSRLLQSCSQAFDVSVFEIFFTWRIGGCLCSATKDVLFRDIENAIRVLGITHLSLTPTVAALVNPENVPQVQFLVTAGEAVTEKVFKMWAHRGLYQGYGPSETTNICSINPITSYNDTIDNIGRPFKNTSAFVLSPVSHFSLVPRGGEGEFCFGGSQVFRGYLDNNQEVGKIIQHPKYGRLYRSGDFGRLLPNGSMSFTGRKDDQVKIRGQRVELGEINTILLESKMVKDCITIVIDEKTNKFQRLVCFWTAPGSPLADIRCLPPDATMLKSLYRTLETRLPSYMLPSALIPISILPSTSQGKIDKRLLGNIYENLDARYLGSVSQSSQTAEQHAWSDLELKIGKSLAEVSESLLEDINRDTSFFSLGIDSISAISFSRKLREYTNRQVEISEILKHASVIRLAAVISSKSPYITPSTIAEASGIDFGFEPAFRKLVSDSFGQAGRFVHEILPCTPLQEAMLSAAEASTKHVYHNHVVFDVNGNMGRLKQCWQEMVDRHEILRTCFIRTDMLQYPYVQVLLKEFNLRFGIIDGLGNMDEALARIESSSPHGQHNPPYNLDIVEILGATKLVVSMHHALYDGVALEILYEEIETHYRGGLLPPAISFGPFLQAMASMNLENSDKFWQSTLQNFSPSRLPVIGQQTDRSGPPTWLLRLATTYSLSWVEEAIKEHRTSLLAVCHAVWAGIISELIQESDICFGNVVSGRTTQVEGIERLVAPCFNTIPSRLQETHKMSFIEAFRKLQSLNTESLPFQLTPLRRIQSKFSTDGSRLFDTLFILQQPLRALDTKIWSILEDDGAMDFPLVCEIVPRPDIDTLEIIIHSHSSILSSKETHALMVSFEGNLKTALENPRRQMLSAATRERISAKTLERECLPSKAMNRTGRIQPLTAWETQLRDLLAGFTDIPVEKIGRDVSVFRLGLDSISTVQVAARLRELGHRVMASDILENPTISQLDIFIRSNRVKVDQVVAPYDFASFDTKHRSAVCLKYQLRSSQVEAIRPCTPVQEGMLAQSLHSSGSEYINSIWLELSPDVSISNLKTAWTTVTRGHEILRTGFANIEGPEHSFAMITHSNDNFSLPWADNEDDDPPPTGLLDRLSESPWSIVVRRGDHTSVLQFTAHHALYDAQSLQIILSDVAKSYKSNTLSIPVFEPLLGAILAAGEDIELNKEFWQREENKIIVNRFPELTPLQILGSRNLVLEIQSSAFTSDLEGACQTCGVTMQAAGQTAWARLLAAYTGETSTTFGMTLSGRSVHEDANRIAFPSIVTLPVRCDVTGTNRDLLARTMAANATLHKYQFTPLTCVQKWAGYPEGRIFDTLFAYQKLSEGPEEIIDIWKIVKEKASADYAVSLEMQPEVSGKMSLRLTFMESLIPVEHAEMILRQFDALLLDTLRNPHNACDVAPAIETGLLSITPAKESLLPGSENLLHEFVEFGARQWPDKAALEFTTSFDSGIAGVRSWSYLQLDGEGNRVAQLLLQRGITQGSMIGICFDKCPEASFAIVGILKAGCTYVALDPTAPIDRLRFIIKDSKAAIVFTAGRPKAKIDGSLGAEVVDLGISDSLSGLLDGPLRLAREIRPDDTAYCLYTSGTTGTPKGCLITHESVVQFMFFFQRLFAGRWKEDSKWLQFASFHFDVSLVEQFWSWSVGICVASAPRDLIFEDIPAAIRQLGITHIDLTPSLARLIHPDDVPSLWDGIFITGGEQLKQDILDVWGEKGCIHNSYGPTEATIGVTTYPRVPKNGKSSNIGPQFDNVGSFVLKPGTETPVLRGGVGELCVSGVLVGKGYLNRSDLTTEKFPTLKVFNERIYRTGDLVRILHDGCFLFQGRADDQVKLRGQRLELSEINEVIKKSSTQLDEVITFVLKHSTQQKEQLVAFFVLSTPDEDETDSLIASMRDACKTSLPGYMVPTHFIPITALPLTVNNKADSKQLAALYDNLSVDDLQQRSHSSSQHKYWTKREQEVVHIIAQALHVSPLSVNRGANIFELGLDSISIIRFSRTLQEAGLAKAKLSIVKRTPNIDAMVHALLSEEFQGQDLEEAYITANQNITAFSQKHLLNICKELGVPNGDVESIAPCTPVQEGMIYRFLESDVPLYFNKFNFRLDADVDLEKLLAAWNKVIAALQIIRTKFIATDDGYAQVVSKVHTVVWEDQCMNYGAAEKTLALKTPYKVVLSPTSSGKILSLQIFHGLYDGNSLGMLLNSVINEYHRKGGTNYGPPFHSSLPYGPLARVPGAQEFWKDHLKDWHYQPMLQNLQGTENVCATKNIDGVGKGFENLRKELGVTPQALIQAVWLSVLQDLLSSDLTIGVVASGRAIDFKNADKVIGPLFNTAPFHIEIEAGMTAASLISVCHNFNMQMQDYQHTPLKDIQKWSSAKPGQSLFDTLFVFQRPDSDEDFAKGVWVQLEDTPTADVSLIRIYHAEANTNFNAVSAYFRGNPHTERKHQPCDSNTRLYGYSSRC